MGAGQISFGPFVLDRGAGVLLSGGRPIALGQRAYALLDALAATDGPVDKAALIEAAWPGTIVEEGNLTVQIAALRKALGARPDGSEWIVTVPRVGYRLVRATARTADLDWPRPVLAILPFSDLGAEETPRHFAEGIVEELSAALGRFTLLSVISTGSTAAYRGRAVDAREVARELGARYILDGSVRAAGGEVRLGVKLVDGESGAQLWTGRVDGALSDLLNLQDRLSAAVTTLVVPRITNAEIERSQARGESGAAYDLFLRATHKMSFETPQSNGEAIELVEAALLQQPDNGVILALGAWAYEHRISMGWPAFGPDDRARCAALARAGLDRVVGDPRAMAHCAMAIGVAARDYDHDLEILRQASLANPNDTLVASARGIGLLHLGDIEEAWAVLSRVLDIEPAEGDVRFPLTGLAHICMIRGQFEEALVYARRSLVANRHFDATYWMLIAASAQLGRLDEAHVHLRQLQELVPDVTLGRIRAGQFARYPDRMANIFEGLRLAGLAE